MTKNRPLEIGDAVVNKYGVEFTVISELDHSVRLKDSDGVEYWMYRMDLHRITDLDIDELV